MRHQNHQNPFSVLVILYRYTTRSKHVKMGRHIFLKSQYEISTSKSRFTWVSRPRESRVKFVRPLSLNTINSALVASLTPNNEADVMVAPAGDPDVGSTIRNNDTRRRWNHGVRHIPGDPKISSFALLIRGPFAWRFRDPVCAESSILQTGYSSGRFTMSVDS